MHWTGESWDDTELTPGGGWFPQTQPGKVERGPHYSGGIALDHANTNNVYLSREIKGVFEIEKWQRSEKEGSHWQSSAITSNSIKNNIRPVVPRQMSDAVKAAESPVLWMYGDYIHYKNFQTGIKAKH